MLGEDPPGGTGCAEGGLSLSAEQHLAPRCLTVRLPLTSHGVFGSSTRRPASLCLLPRDMC